MLIGMSSLHKVMFYAVITIYRLRQKTFVDLREKYVWLSKAGLQSNISLKEKVKETKHCCDGIKQVSRHPKTISLSFKLEKHSHTFFFFFTYFLIM